MSIDIEMTVSESETSDSDSEYFPESDSSDSVDTSMETIMTDEVEGLYRDLEEDFQIVPDLHSFLYAHE